MNILEASKQWSNRPQDERYWTIKEAYDRTTYLRNISRASVVTLNKLTIDNEDGELCVVGNTGKKAKMTNYAFGQLCTKIGAPAGYLRELDPDLAKQCLQSGLNNSTETGKALFYENGSYLMRCINSESYGRIWNDDVFQRCLDLESQGWKVPPARPSNGDSVTRIATDADVLHNAAHPTLGVKVGDVISPAGIYASDRDMFCFMIDENKPIDDGTGNVMYRGFYMYNSEVGDKKFGIVSFLFESVCGNHIVWNARNVSELSIIHRKNAEFKFNRQLMAEIKKYSDSSTSELTGKIESARRFSLGDSRDDVLDLIFGKKILSRANAEKAYEYAIEQSDLHHTLPNSAWGYVQGITRMSQDAKHQGDRVEIDNASSKILAMVNF